ncbi:hypothetical protein ACIQVK_44695 [Streptomyces sp. NPDC090493]|uniref:hypothetical protein n=1 Tax=Streptomyces sp. NPDC090493 TaxID=3365964 RepID=UPI0037FA1616
MKYDDDPMAEYQERRRQEADLEYIRRYYALEQRHGIHVAIGGRVRSAGREGAIVDTSGQYLMVQFDGDEQPVRRHVTANMEYATTAGWTAAKPVPDPCPNVLQGA